MFSNFNFIEYQNNTVRLVGEIDLAFYPGVGVTVISKNKNLI